MVDVTYVRYAIEKETLSGERITPISGLRSQRIIMLSMCTKQHMKSTWKEWLPQTVVKYVVVKKS
tara:strand:+ start:592 stop:786 length:195 start_codon:yes stop_codon:yes gene_type:complete